LNIDDIKKAVIPDDISKAREGFYISPSQPTIVWISPTEILESLGEPASFEMVKTITSSIMDSYAQDGIEIVVIGDE
jgi:hypothetical protein